MFFFGAIVLFVAELAAFVAVGDQLGFGWAVLLLLAVSALGPFMIRRAGIGVLTRAQRRLAEGALPTRELLDGVVVLFGAVLICVPGFITDATGLLLTIGPVRRLFIRAAGKRVARSIRTMSPQRWKVVNVAANSGDGERSDPAVPQERLGGGPRDDA